MTELTVIEICAGAGGQSLGLHRAGFSHRLAVEIDDSAADTLKHNLARVQPESDPNKVIVVGDVADTDIWDPSAHSETVDLFAGGVPCPPFSVAGKQLGSGDERDLFAWAVQAVGPLKPKALLLENVRGLNDTRFAAYRQAVVDQLEKLGYVANWELLHARDYGVPQLRPRMVLVALAPEYAPYFEWPEPKPTTETVGTTLAGLMGQHAWEHLDEWVHRAADIAPTIVGGSKKHGGADLGPTRAKRAWETLWVDGRGLADDAPATDWDPHLPENRRGPRLTVDMVAKLQGWDGPDYEWEFLGRKTSRYRQVGNAFPPPVARAVGEAIARALRKEGTPGGLVPERRMHDEVYRVMRDREDWLTAGRIQQLLGGSLPLPEVERRIALISRDFTVEERSRGGRTAYRLDEWKAFQGQEWHHRHEAFAASRSRSRIS